MYLDTCDSTTLAVSDSAKGIFEGYAAVWGEVPFTIGPRGGTFLEPGTFKKTLKERKEPYPVLWYHKEDQPFAKTISINEDSKGLAFSAQANLDKTLGREVFSDIEGGYVKEMSIGFNPIKVEEDSNKEELHIREVKLNELSAVTFAANPKARIKRAYASTTVNAYCGLPIAEIHAVWDAGAARERVEKYDNWNQAFIDTECRYQIADLVNDELMVVPGAIYAIGAKLATGNIEASDDDIARYKTHIARYYAEMGEATPWTSDTVSIGHITALINEALRTKSIEPLPDNTHSQIVREPQMDVRAQLALNRLKRNTNDLERLFSNGPHKGQST